MVPLDSSNDVYKIDWPAWIQAISAVFAAVGLIVTLSLQRKSNKSQQDLLERDYDRFIKESQPLVKLTLGTHNTISGGIFIINILNNPIFNMYFENNSPDILTFKRDISKKRNLNFDSPIYVSYSLVGNSIITKALLSEETIDLTFYFNDKLGNSYSQRISKKIKYKSFHHHVPVFLKKL